MIEPNWRNLPEDLRERAQWLLAGPDATGALKVPTTVTESGYLAPGSDTNTAHWLDFDTAISFAQEYRYGLGYCLHPDDPFTCVDFDVKNQHNAPNNPEKWTTKERFEQMQSIVADLDSYTELSQSGQGVHVWVRGKIGEGLKRASVEVYSQWRFVACTGRAINSLPINQRQEEITMLVSAMRAAQEAARSSGLLEGETEIDDNELMRRAWNAHNGEKFRQLWAGDWQSMGYPSQSEADLSLMSMLTFYSRNNEQCRRLFRHSKLGEREKALKNDRYLDYTLRLIRGRQAKEDSMLAAVDLQAIKLAESVRKPEPVQEVKPVDDATRAAAMAYAASLQAAGLPPSPPPPVPPSPPVAPPVPDGGLPWPPGMMGRLAQFIYHSAPRPVREVAIVAALGWYAGVCGKAWVIPGSGLNLYIILVARSAIGKEAMHSGLAALTHRLRDGAPGAGNFVDFSDFASGPALAKACAAQPSFVNVAGEWGRKLQRLASQQTDGPMQSLRTVMTNLYQKSGPASIVGGITYSSKDNNIASISGVSFSMIGETTPSTLYASLTESMMEDGFLSRFNIVEYAGERPPANPYQNLVPDNILTSACQELCTHALTLNGNHQRCEVQRTKEAAVLMDAFDLECDAQINASAEESNRQMWNRAHLKMARVAALLSVADNHMQPVIQVHHVEWALDLVRRDIALMQRRMASGDVGQGDSSRERKLLHVMHEFLSQPVAASYGVPAAMPRDGVVPRKYLQMRVYSVAAFAAHPYGAKRALDDSIASLIDSGYIVEMDKTKAAEAYTFQGRCFRIVNLPKFN